MDDITLDVDDENACSIDMIHVSINKRVQIREMSTADPTLRALQRLVYSGWPDTIKNLQKDVRPYWSYRDEIGISDGVMFKGKQVIIPDALRSDILHQLHKAHLRIEKTRLLMRESVYLPNIYKDRDDGETLCSMPGEPDGASSTTSPRSRYAIHTVDQGGQRFVPDKRGQLSTRYRLSLQVLSCREDALNNQHFNRQQVCTVVRHVWTTTRNSHRQRPTVCKTAIRRHVQ